MATDVKAKDGTGSGNVQNGLITVKTNRNISRSQVPPEGTKEYSIADFDAAQADLSTRFDDPRYYQGDAVT